MARARGPMYDHNHCAAIGVACVCFAMCFCSSSRVSSHAQAIAERGRARREWIECSAGAPSTC
eukprot:5405976-Lingulodinium_polyedra.AAC.1